MKLKTTLTLIFVSFFTYGQTQAYLQFTSPKQEFDFTKDSISLEFKIINPNEYKSPYPITFEVSSDLKNYKIIGVTEKSTIHKAIKPDQRFDNLIVKIPISKKNVDKINSITFKIDKVGINGAFAITNNTHVVVFTKKEENKSTLSLSHNGSDIVKVDFSKDKEIKIPFKINAKGYVPITEDTLRVKMRVKNLKAFKDTISFKSISRTTEHNFKIKKEKGSKVFNSVLKEIDTLDKLELQIVGTEAKSKKDFKHSSKPLNYFLKTSNKKEVRYNFYVGTNFDLKDRFEATSFYSEFDVFAPDLFCNNTGLRFGAYKNNNTTSLDEDTRTRNILQVSNTTQDSLTFSTKKVSSVPTVSNENLGIYFELMHKIKESQSKNFKLYSAIHIEAVQRNDKFTFTTNDLITLSTSTISLDSLNNNRTLLAQLTTPTTFSRKYIDSYFALSFPMHYYNPDSDLEFFLNPIIGTGNPGLEVNGIKNTRLRTFGAFQAYFVVASQKGLGIRLGGEIRHYFNYITKPIFNLNLSTKINLESIIGNSKKEG